MKSKGQMSEQDKHSEPGFNFKDIENEELFSVPKGYFDELERDILSKTVDQQPAKRGKVVTMWQSIYPYAAAAALVLIISVGIIWNSTEDKMDSSQNIEAMIDEVPSAELIAFLNESDITTDELLAGLDLNQLDLISEDDDLNLINDDELEDVLDELEDIEIEEILSDI